MFGLPLVQDTPTRQDSVFLIAMVVFLTNLGTTPSPGLLLSQHLMIYPNRHQENAVF